MRMRSSETAGIFAVSILLFVYYVYGKVGVRWLSVYLNIFEKLQFFTSTAAADGWLNQVSYLLLWLCICKQLNQVRYQDIW